MGHDADISGALEWELASQGVSGETWVNDATRFEEGLRERAVQALWFLDAKIPLRPLIDHPWVNLGP